MATLVVCFGGLEVLDLASGIHSRVGLPRDFPEVVGPIVAG
jgi:hypothetical protein